jgi:hypothetical protein
VRVSFNDGSYALLSEAWDGTTVYEYDDLPDTAFAPQRGFGQVFHDNPDLQSQLGWAVTEGEQGYTATRQTVDLRGADGGVVGDTYLSLPDGRAVAYSFPTESRWRILP